MMYGEAVFLCQLLYRRRLHAMAPARRPRRLGVDANDMVSGNNQPVQDRRGKGRRSHEDEVECLAWSRVVHRRAPTMPTLGGREGFAALHLGELAQDHSALERGQMVDEKNAVEMVDLVLQAHR